MKWDNATVEDESRWFGTIININGKTFKGTLYLHRVFNKGELLEVNYGDRYSSDTFRINVNDVEMEIKELIDNVPTQVDALPTIGVYQPPSKEFLATPDGQEYLLRRAVRINMLRFCNMLYAKKQGVELYTQNELNNVDDNKIDEIRDYFINKLQNVNEIKEKPNG